MIILLAILSLFIYLIIFQIVNYCSNNTRLNIALCFCVRDCEKYLPRVFENIELVKSLDFNVHSIFVYDNCSDNSPDILQNYKNTYPNIVTVKEIENKSDKRTVRISKARNECLNTVYNELNDIKYHMMIDADDVCSNEWNIDILNKYLNNFDNDNWDCMTFNKTNYYDIWALLFDDYRHNCWGFYDKSPIVVNIMTNVIVDKLKNLKSNSLEVLSAFNGFGIYKTDRFKGFYYDGLYSNFHPLITDDERNKTKEILINKHNLDVEMNTEEEHIHREQGCCEHLYYHLSAHKKGRKIKISKYKVC